MSPFSLEVRPWRRVAEAMFVRFVPGMASVACAMAALAPLPAFASLPLAQKNACTACHAPDRKLVGPSYQDVAKKYQGQPDAVPRLVASIRQGGAGKWGPVPMPAQPNLGEADARTLAEWVLGGAR